MTRTTSLAARAALCLALGAAMAGCPDEVRVVEPDPVPVVVEPLTQGGVDKIDLLLAVDNSISMADKQQILAAAVPDLVNRLVTPNCVDLTGNPTGSVADAQGECPAGSRPEFPPIRNINVGIISSSLGDLTSGACASATVVNPDDKGHLLTRAPTPVSSYMDQGFLAWDPDNARGGQTVAADLVSDFASLVVGVDQVGCGYEMPMEAILRFLVDPDPYDALVEDPPTFLKEVGTDAVLLEQRKSFLRPDSLVAILILSDENDCSIDISGQGFLTLRAPFYRSTSECESGGPQDACCSSCGLPNAGCDAGGNCANPKYTANEDHPSLKCFHQKERYGVDFLYPVARYVNAFTQPTIDPTKKDYAATDAATAVANPLFADLNGGGLIRDPSLVLVGAIVGVPWQAIARRDGGGQPDLSLGFKTFEELEPDLDALVGDPDALRYPTDPFMIESVSKRSGTSAIVGASPTGSNPINGNDYNIATASPNDLQYACIFPLVTPVPNGPDCDDCVDASCDKPLCNGTTQERAKAYPGVRELALLRGMGAQGIFTSICPAEVDDSSSPIFGYRPAVNTIIDRMRDELAARCLPRELAVGEDGALPCAMIEASVADGADCCAGIAGRAAIPEELENGDPNPVHAAVLEAKASDYANPNWSCFCEITQVAGAEAQACRTELDPQAAAQGDGWCYVSEQVGDPALVAACPVDERRIIRFVGEGEPRSGSAALLSCFGD